MADQALYRKYRSADFSEVVGQAHIIDSLSGALEAGNISHAYLFTGPRGVGKTSVARLLAKRLNHEAGDAASMDIVEIDAASNRSIDAIRDLREKVNLAPSIGRYKVYIIDEVHMLTTEAFNALLKTLEEPPAHAIFILATTEVQKIPETIISRTQRYAFRPISQGDIIALLTKIAAAEKITTEVPAIELIAKLARGGLRDATSLFDQVASSGQPVTLKTVQSLLGYTDDESLQALADAILNGQTTEVLASLDRLKASGIAASQLSGQLIDWWRELLGKSVAGESDVPLGMISRVLEVLIASARSPYPDLSLEVALVKLTLHDEPSVQPQQRTATKAAPAAAVGTPVPPRSASAATGGPASGVTRDEPVPETDQTMIDKWPKVLAAVKRTNQNVFTVIQMSEATFETSRITLKVRVKFHKDQLTKQQHRQVIEEAMAKVYGRPVGLIVEVDRGATKQAAPKPPAEDDLIESAMEILGGEIVDD